MIFGEVINDLNLLKKFNLPFEFLEENKWSSPPISVIEMFRIASKNITYYSLFDKKGGKIGNVFYIIINFSNGYDSLHLLVLVSPQNAILSCFPLFTMLYGSYETIVPEILKNYIGKNTKNLKLDRALYPGAEETLEWIEKIFYASLLINRKIEGLQ